MDLRWLPWLGVVIATGGFLLADRVWDFAFGVRTYWPVLMVVYVVLRLGVEESRQEERA